MNKVAKIFSYIAFVFAFCFMAIGYAAVQDTLLVDGTVSVDGYILKYDFDAADTEGYTLSSNGTLEIKELYYDPDAVNPNNNRVGVNYRVVGIADNGFSGYESKGSVTTLVLPDSVDKIGENAFSDFAVLSRVEFGAGFTEFKASTFEDSPYLLGEYETNMIIPENSLVVCNQLGADISKYVTNSTSYTIELASAYGADRPVVTAYTGDTAEQYTYTTVAQSKFELGNNGKLVDLLSTDRYTYATLEAGNALKIRNGYSRVVENDTMIVDSGGMHTLGTGGTVHALPKTSAQQCIAVLDGIVPAGARTDGWIVDVRNTTTGFETSVTSVEVVDSISLQGDLKNLFYTFDSLKKIDFKKADFSKVTNLYEFFDGCKLLTEVSFDESLDTSSVTNMSKMFSYCQSLTTDKMNDILSKLDTQSVTNMKWMFLGCSSLTSFEGSALDYTSVEDMTYMFDGCTGLTTVTFSEKLIAPKLKSMSNMFSRQTHSLPHAYCTSLTEVCFNGGIDAPKLTDMGSMFYYCLSLQSVSFNGDVKTPELKSMGGMFQWCEKLSAITFDGSFDTSNVTSMSGMFNNCKALRTVDLSKFSTPQLQNMSSMFSYSAVTEVDFSGFDTSNVRYMQNMFQACGSLVTVKWSPTVNTSKVENMSTMFDSCRQLTNLDLTRFDTSNVTNMSSMFNSCHALKNLDLSSFDTSNVTSMNSMFKDYKHPTIYVSDTFVTDSLTSTASVFTWAYSLTGGGGTNANEISKVDGNYHDAKYAVIDGVNGQIGYFKTHTVENWANADDGIMHYGTCTAMHDGANVCGVTVYQVHTYENNHCTKCEQAEHTVTEWVSNSDETHSGTCTGCGVTVTKLHTTYDESGVCTDCGYKCLHPTNNNGLNRDYGSNGTSGHHQLCTICGYHTQANLPHTYVDGVCSACGDIRYTLAFINNEGTNAPANVIGYTATLQIPNTIPTRDDENYVFLGWTTNSNTDEVTAENLEYTYVGDGFYKDGTPCNEVTVSDGATVITLYAKWLEITDENSTTLQGVILDGYEGDFPVVTAVKGMTWGAFVKSHLNKDNSGNPIFTLDRNGQIYCEVEREQMIIGYEKDDEVVPITKDFVIDGNIQYHLISGNTT